MSKVGRLIKITLPRIMIVHNFKQILIILIYFSLIQLKLTKSANPLKIVLFTFLDNDQQMDEGTFKILVNFYQMQLLIFIQNFTKNVLMTF